MQRKNAFLARLNPAKDVPAMPPVETTTTVKFPELFRPNRVHDFQSYTPPRVHRRHKPSPHQETLWSPRMDPDVIALAEATKEENAPLIVPEAQRPWIRQNLGLRDYYEDWMRPELERRLQAGTLSRSTLANDRSALGRWERCTRPEQWDKDWPGFPIGYIVPRIVEQFLERLFATCSSGTAKSTWCHIRQMFNHAAKTKAIDFAPKPAVMPKAADKKVKVFTPEQITAAYYALKPWTDLQVSFVLAIAAGLRTVDLFCLDWSEVTLAGPRPNVDFIAMKTDKRQVIPLAPLTIEHLRRLPSIETGGLLFPGRTNVDMENPEHSKPACRRREIINTAFREAELFFPKPIQTARATCNTLLENWRTGVGQFVLGHGLTLNSRHYHEPSDLIYDGVCSADLPDCFADF